MLFGTEWCTPEPKKSRPAKKRPRKRERVPEWLVSLLACPSCRGPRLMGTGREALYIACGVPGCTKLVPRLQAAELIRQRRGEVRRAGEQVPEPDKCLRMAWRFLRRNAKGE